MGDDSIGQVYDASASESDDSGSTGAGGYDLSGDESLSDRLNSLPDSDDEGGDGDAREETGSSERDPAPVRGGKARGTPGSLSDDPGGDRSFSRMVRNMGIKERELSTARGQVQALETEVRRLSEAGRLRNEDPDDVVEHVRSILARRLGAERTDDPRVLSALRELSTDLTVEAFADPKDPSLESRRQERNRMRQERERHTSYQRQIDELRQERLEVQREGIRAQISQGIGAHLDSEAESLPYLTAAGEAGDIDPVSGVFDILSAGVRSGRIPDPRDATELREAIDLITANLEDHYRGLAERLTRRSNVAPAAANPKSAILRGKQMVTTRDRRETNDRAPAARDRGQDGRTAGRAPVPSRGGGGRGAAHPDLPPQTQADDDEDDSLGARIDRRLRMQQRANRSR